MTELNQLAASSGDIAVSPEGSAAEHDIAARPSRPLEIVVAVTALVLSVVAIVLSQSIYLRMSAGGLDPKWWPTVLSSIAAGLSLILVGFALFGTSISRGELESVNEGGWARMLTALALSALYVFAWAKVGYVVPTALYLAALLWLFGLRAWKGLIIFPLVTTGFIYGLFHYALRVPL